MGRRYCGGCEGQGGHWRWCPQKVGWAASQYGQMSDEAEALGDRCGVPEVANHLWQAAGMLRRRAIKERVRFQSSESELD